ncbi:MAG: hypothetical protein CSB48_05135 [Proteobacteria bacterium]|nr:MAG: hypothetical protein CSB48_05135 [Pseudomonadota bacterium]PIE40258.1 MAG: hypothetical protein CSA51_01625 [Gammaproteobacteria bacterium]
MTIRCTALSCALITALAAGSYAEEKPAGPARSAESAQPAAEPAKPASPPRPKPAEEAIDKESTDYVSLTTKIMDYALIDDRYKAKTLASELIIGTYISDYVTVEGRAGWGFGKDEATKGLEVGVVYWLGWYMGIAYPVTEFFNIHGKLGFSYVEADTSRDDPEKFENIPKDFLQSTFSMSWAISGDLLIIDNFYITGEYGRLHNDTTTGIETTHYGIGILYEF